MNNDLIKRYIYAVTCHLPAKSQPEIEEELESMIMELLDARCGDAQPGEEDIRAVLTELGAPEELAVKYSGDENKALISGIYFIWYKKLLKIVLPIAAAGVAFATLLSEVFEWQPLKELHVYAPELISSVISGAASAAVQAFLWVTIIFVILERKKVSFSGEEFLSKLQPVPDKRAQIKIHEPIINVLWHIAAAVLFLGFPYLIGAYTQSTGWISAFDENYIRGAWYLVVLWAASGIACEAVKLIERRYSKRVALATVIAHTLTGISAVLFFSNRAIMNPAFVEQAGSLLKGEGAGEIGRYLGYLNVLILAVMLFALALDIGVTTWRAFRYDK